MLSGPKLVHWYAECSPGAHPERLLCSGTVLIYKAVLLLWSLWVAAEFVHWLHWGWIELYAWLRRRTRRSASGGSARRGAKT